MKSDGGQPRGAGLDRAELERLWRRERRWVAAVLLAHMPRGESLEDLLQEVALAVVRHAAEVRDPLRLRGWLRTVAMNVARDAGRKATTRRKHGLDLRGTELPEVEALADPRTDSEGEAREARRAARRVQRLAEGLPPAYREALLLRCVQGLSQRRIAELLGVPETTVETRLVRGRRMLREAWSRQTEGADGADTEN